jgi:two-component system, NtrC family, response regulator HydG
MQPKLLIADDDQEMRKWVRLVFRSLQARIFEAGDGVELLSVLQREGPFDLVITDVRMPRKSGLEAVAEARENGCDVRVILLTGYLDDVSAEAVAELGNVFLLTKPIDGWDLFAATTDLFTASADFVRGAVR